MKDKTFKIIINGLAVVAILAGIFGMLFCFPFLWSAQMEDLVGSGFPFVAGSILFGSGLVALAIFNRQTNN